METTPVENQIPLSAAPLDDTTSAVEEVTATVAIPITTVAAEPVLKVESSAANEEEEAADEEEEAGHNTRKAPKKIEEEYLDEDEVQMEVDEEEDEWVSDHEPKQRRRGRKARMSESEDDEDYGRSKKRKVVIERKAPRSKSITISESSGMRALRDYTSALKLGPRCFRNLNKITNPKDREAELIKRLHDNECEWNGDYPSAADIMLAKEQTRQKKAEKTKQFILDEDMSSGVRTARKAAQKARDFVKTLGEEDDDKDEEEADVDMDAAVDDNKDDE